LVAGAVGVFAGEGGRERVFVGDVAADCWIEAAGFLMREAMWDKDHELVSCVRWQAKQGSKVKVTNGWPLRLGAELGSSTVTQGGECSTVCVRPIFMHFS